MVRTRNLMSALAIEFLPEECAYSSRERERGREAYSLPVERVK